MTTRLEGEYVSGTGSSFPPLPPGEGRSPVRSQKFIDIEVYGTITAGTIRGDVTIEGSLTLEADFQSSNWDGGTDLSGGRDATATAGYFFDYSAGAAQLKTIYADGGDLKDLSLTGTLSLSGSGELVTATSGQRLEITDNDRILFYTGLVAETQHGYIIADDTDSANPAIWIRSPSIAAATHTLQIESKGVVISGIAATTGTSFHVTKNAHGAIIGFGNTVATPLLEISGPVGGGGVKTITFQNAAGTLIGKFQSGPTSTHGLFMADGTISNPAYSWANDGDTGMYRVGANHFAATVGGHAVAQFQQAGQNLSGASYRTGGALFVNAADIVLGGTSGNNILAGSFNWNVNANNVGLTVEALRDATGTTWTTAAVGFRRVTDATSQSSLWFYQSNVGINISGPLRTLHVAGSFAAQPGTTGSGSNATWGLISGSDYQLLRNTSARKYKSRINYNVIDKLASMELKPAKFYRKDDQRWFYDFIADDIAEEDELLGIYEDGEIENYEKPGVMAVMSAKIIKLEEEVRELRMAA